MGAKSLLGNLIPFEKNILAGSSGLSRLGIICKAITIINTGLSLSVLGYV